MRLLVALVALLQLQTSLCFTGPFTGGSQLLSLGLRSGNGLVGARSDVPRLRSGAKTAVSMADDIGDKKKWQDLAEKLADPFVSPFEKPAIAVELATMSTDIVQSVQDVASGKVLPEEELLGKQGKKQLRGARAVARQLSEDILPSASTEGQKLVESLQQGSVRGSGSGSLSAAGERLQRQILQQLDEATATGSFAGPGKGNLKLPSPEELLTEVRNAVQGTDEGLESPAYEVVSAYGDWEIRKYDAMLTSTVAMKTAEGSRLEQGGNAFNSLASFLFGENTAGEAMAMTTPVITTVREDGDSTSMSFVLPSKYGLETAPRPKTSDISLEEVPPVTVAAIEFPGFATKEEVVRQRETLLRGLQAKGWVRDESTALSVTVLQYNAPYTLPTVRRNEVLIKLDEGWIAPAAEGGDAVGAVVGEEKGEEKGEEPQWEEAEKKEVKAEEKEVVMEKEEKEEGEEVVMEEEEKEEDVVMQAAEAVEAVAKEVMEEMKEEEKRKEEEKKKEEEEKAEKEETEMKTEVVVEEEEEEEKEEKEKEPVMEAEGEKGGEEEGKKKKKGSKKKKE